MPVPRALAVVLEQLRRQLAADVERRQPGPLGAGADQLRAADPGDGLLDADLAQGFDRNEGVLAAADRDEGVAAQAELLPLPFQHFSLPFKGVRSEEHTSELQSLMRISYAVFCLKKKPINKQLH